MTRYGIPQQYQIRLLFLLATISLLLVAQPARSQNRPGPNDTPADSLRTQGRTGGDMMSMMREYRDDCEKTGRVVDEALTVVDNARQSNDPKKLKAALAKAESALREMHSHVQNCEAMMSRMGGTQRGGTRERHEGEMMPPDSSSRVPRN